MFNLSQERLSSRQVFQLLREIEVKNPTLYSEIHEEQFPVGDDETPADPHEGAETNDSDISDTEE